MENVIINKSDIADAMEKGGDELFDKITAAVRESIGNRLTADTMARLNVSQTTLLAYSILREEVMDGGFIQLIYNGYGGFMFLNPVARIMKQWGLNDLSKLLYTGKTLYFKYKDEIEKDCSDEEFMALFERFEAFDELDDAFVENEEAWTMSIAEYIKTHLNEFISIE